MSRRDQWLQYCEENQHRRKSSPVKKEGSKKSRVRSARKTSEGIIRFMQFLKSAGSFLAKQGSEVANVYSQTLAEADATLEEQSGQLARKTIETLLKFEELQYRLGIRISRDKLEAQIDGQWVRFVVLDLSNPNDQLNEMDVAVLLGDLHRSGIPFKMISRLRKNVGEVAQIAGWVEREFAQHYPDWDQIEGAGLNPEDWINQFRWLVDYIARVHQDWKSWLVLPVEGLTKRLTKKFRRLGKDAVYELVFELFQNLDEYNEDSIEFFRAILASIHQGEEPFEAIFPSWVDVKDSYIQTSDGVWMAGLDLVTIGADYVPLETKGRSRRRKEKNELVIRDLEWLRHELDVCLDEDSRNDQIWIMTSQLPVKDRRGMISNVRRHIRTFGGKWDNDGSLLLPDDRTEAERNYLNILTEVTNFLRRNPTVSAFQQSYSLLLKSGSSSELSSLVNRVELILGNKSVWFERLGMRNLQWDGFRSMLPVIWLRDVLEEHGIPRNTIPLPEPKLHSVFFEDRYEPPPVGSIVGMLDDGTSIAIGAHHWGIIGSTSVGKSILLKMACAMLYPIDPLATELFVIDMIEAELGMPLIGWYSLLVELFGGVAIFPGQFKTPKAMRDWLDKQTSKRVFLYMPSSQVRDIAAFDMVYLEFVMHRMTRGGIKRRLVCVDELNNWLRTDLDPRVDMLINRIMDQGAKYDTTVLYTLKTLEGTMKSLPKLWAELKTATAQWLIFNTYDPESVPETIGFPPRSAETILKADRIVEAVRNIRIHGAFTKIERALGRCVLITGDVVETGNIIVPPGLLPVLQRKVNVEWSV